MLEQNIQRTDTIDPIESHCREFEAAWQADERPDIGLFLDRVEDGLKGPLLVRLVLLDGAQRRRFGDTPLVAQYKTRFPEYAQEIDEALASEDTQTKSLAVTTPYVATSAELNQSAAQVRTKGRENLPLDRVIKSLTDSNLMRREEVDAFLDALPASSRPQDGKGLAEALFRQKKLTHFQAQTGTIGPWNRATNSSQRTTVRSYSSSTCERRLVRSQHDRRLCVHWKSN